MSLIDDPGTPDPGTPDPGTPDPGKSTAPEWLKGIADVDVDLINDPSLKAITNPAELVKSFVNAQKLIGKDRVVIPTDKSSETELAQFWQKMGRPDKAEDYKIDLGETKSFDEQFVGKFTELAHKHNILPAQAQAMMKELNEYESSQDTNFQADLETKVEEAKASLVNEWGDAYKNNIGKAIEVIKEFGDADVFEHFKQAGYGSDPKFLKFLLKVSGEKLGEDSITPGDSVEGGLTLDEVNRRINEAYSDKAYTDSGHPDHKRKVAEIQKYFKVLEKYSSKPDTHGF